MITDEKWEVILATDSEEYANIANEDHYIAKNIRIEYAHAISAVPELLAACKDGLEDAHTVAERSGISDGDPFWAYIEDAADAISKAEPNSQTVNIV